MASADPRSELTCSICVELFKGPVTLPCGHSFCQSCITQAWDKKDDDNYSCPECKKTYRRRPPLERTVRLANITEYFSSSQAEPGQASIFCSHCIHTQVPAVTSCLHCEASLCDNHLRVHNRSPDHVFSEPSTAFHRRKCPDHRKVLEYYCTEDSACICVTCRMDGDHRGHRVEPLNTIIEMHKSQLRNVLQTFSTKRREMEKRIQRLREHTDRSQEKATGVIERVAVLFRDLRIQLDELEKRVLQEVSSQHEILSSISDLIQRLEIRKGQLTRQMSHIEGLCYSTDPLVVLQEGGLYGEDLDAETGEGDSEEDLYNGVLDEGLVSEILHTGLSDIITGVKSGIYTQGPANVLLDVKTAANDICLSDNLKTVSLSEGLVNREGSAERFQDCGQVLSAGNFSFGRHYWEVETSELGDCAFGVAYTSIDRDSGFGGDNKSWCLCKWYLQNHNSYIAAHNSVYSDVRHKVSCNRFGIYLDYEAGRLSFYELCVPIRHLHTFTATFTEPLHAAFGVSGNSNLSSVWIKIGS